MLQRDSVNNVTPRVRILRGILLDLPSVVVRQVHTKIIIGVRIRHHVGMLLVGDRREFLKCDVPWLRGEVWQGLRITVPC